VRQVDAKESLNWKIPTAVSNWKNAKGFIIPLDKRLVLDGRMLQETKINNNFAKLSEALYIAEQKAREDTELRSLILKEQALREKEKKEAAVRNLAMQARIEKLGLAYSDFSTAPAKRKDNSPVNSPSVKYKAASSNATNEKGNPSRNLNRQTPWETKESTIVEKNQLERNNLREQRRRDRERERRLDEAGEHGFKRSKLTRDHDRDISESIALGMAHLPSPYGDVKYDQRLFHLAPDLQSGFGNEENYHLYDN